MKCTRKKNLIMFLLTFVLISGTSIFSGCSDDGKGGESAETDAQAVAADKEALEIIYASGDSASSVTAELTLAAAGSQGSTISWSSSNTGVITDNGTVNRPNYSSVDANITLAATISKGSASDTKDFALTVIKAPRTDAEAVAEDKASLSIGYASGDSASSVTANLTLATTGSHGSAISWSSGNTAVITDNGTISRPAYGSGDANVTLTATISKGSASDTKIFDPLTVKAWRAGDKIAYSANGVSFSMAFVPGGIIFPTETDDSGTATVADDYQIGESEVTYELWYAVHSWAILSGGYTFANPGREGNDGTAGALPTDDAKQEPVTTVNWRDAMIFCNAITEWYNEYNNTSYSCAYYTDEDYTTPIRTSTNNGSFDTDPGSEDTPYIKAAASGNTDMANCTATGFRLLTGNEWELAARFIEDGNDDGDILDADEYYPGNYASGATADYNNPAATEPVAWYGDSTGSTHEVKTKIANALGIYEMSGNVLEWCFTGDGSERGLQGGYWSSVPYYLQVGYVDYVTPHYGSNVRGFRLGKSE